MDEGRLGLNDTVPSRPQWMMIGGAIAITAILAYQASAFGITKAVLLLLGVALGLVLFHASFGFSGAYRRFIEDRDVSGVVAQLVMLAVAILLFAPFLSAGEIAGRRVVGAVAPVGVGMAFGAFLFGVGMQIAGGCASGTLFTAGGGSSRMVIVLLAFCAGAFAGSLHLGWWNELPRMPAMSLGKIWGWPMAVAAQLVFLAFIGWALYKAGGRLARPLWSSGGGNWLRGPLPFGVGGIMLALLAFAVLATAGHPWSVTWGFTLWGAKVAAVFGWEPVSSRFWDSGFPARALARPVLSDNVSLTNIGIMLGAMIASAAASRLRFRISLSGRDIATAIIGGLLLGYGARLAYGCNIGAFFSGVASSSLHGWVWIAAAAVGNVVGVRLRKPAD